MADAPQYDVPALHHPLGRTANGESRLERLPRSSLYKVQVRLSSRTVTTCSGLIGSCIMADDSAQQKTSPTLATTSAARMAAEALAFNPLSARVQEMLATTSAARMAAEALTFDPSKAMQKALLANP